MKGRRYHVYAYILKYVILSQLFIPGVLSCILLLNGWTPLSVYERTVLADIVISGKVLQTFKEYRTSAQTYTAKVKILEIYKGLEYIHKISSEPGSYNIYNISNFGDKKMCYADVMDSESYIFFLTVYKRRLSAQYDDIFGAAVEFTRFNEEEVIKQLGWDFWSPWGSCSRTCNVGIQTRERTCLKQNVSCDGAGIDKRQCNIFSCAGIKDLLSLFGVYDKPRGVLQNTNRTSAYIITKRANLFSPLISSFKYGFPKDFSVLVTSNIPTGSSGYLLTLSDIMGKQRLAVQYGQSSSKLEYSDQNNLPGINSPSFDVILTDDTWHQFAYSVKGNVIKLFVDCEEVMATSFGRSEYAFLGVNLMLSIGPYFARYGDAFEGQLEQLIISPDPEAAALQCSKQKQVAEQAIKDDGDIHIVTTQRPIVVPSTVRKEVKEPDTYKNVPVEWSSWSSCSATCGKGTQSRTLYCVNNIVDINECIPKNTEKEESRECVLQDCVVRCQSNCLNGGDCDTSGRCVCPSDYEGHQCQTPICKPRCANGGQCVRPGKCSCPEGFTGKLCKKALCKPKCKNGGRCVKGGVCSCTYGFIPPICKPFCSQVCHNGGRCVRFNTCKCRRGYIGKDCTKPICRRGCQNGGKCVSPNKCSCPRGYKGRTCRKPICIPQCKNRGKCIFPFLCRCRNGYYGSYCQQYKCRRRCKNGGKCVGPNKCACAFGYYGKWCQKGRCSSPCLNGGRCKNKRCRCPAGFSGRRCEKRSCFYERYVYPHQRSYKKLLKEEYTTKCGPWRWKNCVKTRLKYITVSKILYRTAYRCI